MINIVKRMKMSQAGQVQQSGLCVVPETTYTWMWRKLAGHHASPENSCVY